MHKYIKLDRIYYNSKLSPVKILYILLFKAKPLGYVYTLNSIGKTLALLKKATKTVFRFCFYKLTKNEPFYFTKYSTKGDLLLNVRNGVKILDINNELLTKIFFEHESENVRKQEVEKVKSVSGYDFTPDIYKTDSSFKYYQEEYINGKRIDFDVQFEDWLRNVYNYVLPLIEQFIGISPETVDIKEYLTEKQQVAFNKLNNNSLKQDKVKLIKEFINRYSEIVFELNNKETYLGFSHGDFSQKHILLKQDGFIKVIDWETFGKRSLMFDFYNCLFQKYRKGLNKNKDYTLFTNQIINNLEQRLSNSSDSNISSMSDDLIMRNDYYRKVYYVERVCRIIELHQLDEEVLDTIHSWIQAFQSYEDSLNLALSHK